MWSFRALRNRIPTLGADNKIGAGTLVRGDLKGPGAFRIDGSVEGSVEAEGRVVVGEGGTIEGDVTGRHVIVFGRIRGNVRAAGHLEIGPRGRVVGDISVQSIKMHKGGLFRGTSRMAVDELTSTNPFGVLPPSTDLTPPADVVESGAARGEPIGGRTLPPPVGAVVPPPPVRPVAITPAPVASEERLVKPVPIRKDVASG